jgi:hypothetical protein
VAASTRPTPPSTARTKSRAGQQDDDDDEEEEDEEDDKGDGGEDEDGQVVVEAKHRDIVSRAKAAALAEKEPWRGAVN